MCAAHRRECLYFHTVLFPHCARVCWRCCWKIGPYGFPVTQRSARMPLFLYFPTVPEFAGEYCWKVGPYGSPSPGDRRTCLYFHNVPESVGDCCWKLGTSTQNEAPLWLPVMGRLVDSWHRLSVLYVPVICGGACMGVQICVHLAALRLSVCKCPGPGRRTLMHIPPACVCFKANDVSRDVAGKLRAPQHTCFRN